MSLAYDAALSFLDSENLNYFKVEERELAIVTFGGEDGPTRVNIKAYDESHMIEVEAFPPVVAPIKRRVEVCRLACMINRHLIVGCVSVNPENGEILFRAAQCVRDDAVEPEMFDRLLNIAMSILTDHLPAVMAVVFDGKSAEDALAALEKSNKQEISDAIDELTESEEQPDQEDDEEGGKKKKRKR